MDKPFTFLVAGGGTGGHLFPALAVVEAIQDLNPNSKFHFVGRVDKIEGTIIPKLGYDFHPIKIEGLKSLYSPKNIEILFRIWKSERIINDLLKKYKIDAVIATGAYISYPPCKVASKRNIPIFLIESNVNPGKTISILAPKSTILFTSFTETENFFKNKKIKQIIYSGNPIRKTFFNSIPMQEARLKFGLKPDLKTVFVVGGSLGAKVINQCIEANLDKFENNNIQLLWQTGSNYKVQKKIGKNVAQFDFIEDMVSAYSAADLVVSRSGASALAEIAIIGKPSILIPFQQGLNNEQLRNAKYLEKMNAAFVLMQENINESLINTIINLINNPEKLHEIETNVKKFAKPDASKIIAENILTNLNNFNK
ncbi:MAG TPA: undecaprenyldiphospho-muramoylpentapeptide beta-N-acetylglucosaminyltransferase [Candidatus Kapabacteria bacterium]|nr:undecaprenyldiphospho-muramoylpentapeptide beta-N-acetylglucosaminyltransferase [Candidatus Kapabacteria bacterium]